MDVYKRSVQVSANKDIDRGETLLLLSGYTEDWDRLRAGITKPISYADCVRAHMALIASHEQEISNV